MVRLTLAHVDYDAVLALLTQAAPLLGKGFVSLVAPDYVGQYGRHAFERSMDALKYFTPFGSSEFAVREFLRDDTHRALAIMETWSTDSDDAVRRDVSERAHRVEIEGVAGNMSCVNHQGLPQSGWNTPCSAGFLVWQLRTSPHNCSGR